VLGNRSIAYGNRMNDPTRPGTATRVNSCSVEYAKPILGRRGATTLHIIHTEKPMCSAMMDQIRFLRAICLPSVLQKTASSGFHVSIHRDIIDSFCDCGLANPNGCDIRRCDVSFGTSHDTTINGTQ